eukprot:15336684-Ditylum_brightwellii.AAC.1
MSTSLTDTTDGTATATNGTTTPSPVIGDNYCGAHHAGLLSLLDVSAIYLSHICYAQFEFFLKNIYEHQERQHLSQRMF